MRTHLVQYDLYKPLQNYSGLTDAIKRLGSGAVKPLFSAWLVRSNGNAQQIRDALLPYIDKDDKLLVAEITQDWASWNVPQESVNFLQRPAA